jgi:hypothetical protein
MTRNGTARAKRRGGIRDVSLRMKLMTGVTKGSYLNTQM